MRLRSIHIKGFKSFPLDTTIHFNERVTGVVGPNGSGKSNIVDAIRWVLGEQKTSELRLGNMSDVLFNGTKKRKKSGLAQVTLYFDNTRNLIPTEYNQVAISRLLFRNGESEYRINDVPCRLKDIRGLFADTGVGSDSYAIIALNMVDDILTDTDGSRRKMFEQASGISKYKKRKKETLNKLKSTNADLDRVEDLLFEINNNLKELEKQARRVERFLKIKEQYKYVSTQLNLRQFDAVSINRKKIQEQITEETDKHRSTEAKLRGLEADLQKAKKDIIGNEEELSTYQKQINQLLDSLRKLESDKQLSKQQIEFNKQKRSTLDTEQEQLNEQLHQLEDKLELLKDKIHREKGLKEKLDHSHSVALESYELARAKYEAVKADHDAISDRKQKLEEERFQLEKKKAVTDNQIERLTQQDEYQVKNEAELKEHKKQVQAKLKAVQNEIDTRESTLSSLLSSSEERKQQLIILEGKQNDIKVEKDRLERRMDARINEYDLVKSMVDSLEGYPESIKYLNKSWKSNAVLLSDILYVPDEYKLAVERFLEPYLNHYIVEDQEDAIDAIGLLHGAQKGKANFFILDKLIENPPVTKSKEGFIRAIELLEYDETYYNLFANLLHNVYITDMDIQDVDFMALELDEKDFTILDKKGSFSAGRHSISGGSVGLFEGKKLGRKKNLEKLQREIQQLQDQNEKLEHQLVKLRDEMSQLGSNEFEKELNDIKVVIDQDKLTRAEMEMQLVNLEKQLSEIQKSRQEYQKELKLCHTTLDEIGKAMSLLQDQLAGLFEGEEKEDSSLQALADSLSVAAEQKNNQHIDLIRHQNLLDSLEGELQYHATDLEKTKNKIAANKAEMDSLLQKQQQLEDQLVEMEKLLVQKYEDKRKRENALSDVEKSFYVKRGAITELEENISTIRRSLHQSQFLINELKEKLHDQDFRLQSISERLKIEFNMTLDDLHNFERSEEPLMDLEEKYDRLKRKIENFGEVNTLAIEAYKEMKVRFETIELQKDDILTSQQNLLKTIDEIEKIATERYIETFAVVKEYFKEVFTSLFSEGDTCDILMENPENPLESRIEIIAKPKGKRPKTLNQLSGGEKTLTAIAMLFSLYLYKPAPFCIFDEVDAPLDDANIEKFNKIVKKFSKESQFIIITHNKATMSAVDVLYGVFMQENGVSEVAAVDFREYEPLQPVMNPN